MATAEKSKKMYILAIFTPDSAIVSTLPVFWHNRAHRIIRPSSMNGQFWNYTRFTVEITVRGKPVSQSLSNLFTLIPERVCRKPHVRQKTFL